MITPGSALRDNVAYLQQARDLCASLSPAAYTHTRPPVYRNGIGPHLRHCLDHYHLFLSGWESGRVDYDSRSRSAGVQSDPAEAMVMLDHLIKGLQAIPLSALHSPLQVKMDCGSETAEPWSSSSLLRELQFLISHTVHHYAIIAMILHDQGIPVAPGFGVAPSTLRHEAAQGPCAR